MTCNCYNKINEELHKKNLMLTGYMFHLASSIMLPAVSTDWLDPDKAPRGEKKRPPKMAGSFCPFCGKPVEELLTTRNSQLATSQKEVKP